jgi:hypothetical protein
VIEIDYSAEAKSVAAAFATIAISARAAGTGRTIFARTRFVHRQIAAVEILVMQSMHRGRAFRRTAHGHEAKAASPTGVPICYEVRLHNSAVRCECVLQIVFGGIEGKISNVQFITHVCDVLPITLYLKPVPDHRA